MTVTQVGEGMDILEVLATNLRYYRKAAKLSQETLANKAGLHRTYIGGIEQQRINASSINLQKIAEQLGIEAWQLLKPLDDHEKRMTGTKPHQTK